MSGTIRLRRGTLRALYPDAAQFLAARDARLEPLPLIPGGGAALALARVNPRAALGALTLRDLAQRLVPGVRLASPAEQYRLLKQTAPPDPGALLDPAHTAPLIARIRLYRADALPGPAGERLCEWSRRFADALDRAGLLDERALYERASLAAATAPPLCAVAFYDLNPVQSDLLVALHRAGRLRAAWLPIPAASAWPWRFPDQPWAGALGDEAAWESLPEPPPASARWASVADLDGALRFAGARVRERRAGAAVAVPALDPVTREALARAGVAAGISFSSGSDDGWRGPVGDAVAALLELPASDFAPATLARVLTGPHASNHALGAKFVRALRDGGEPDREGGARLARRPGFAPFAGGLYERLPRPDDEAPVARWTALVRELLEPLLRAEEGIAGAFLTELGGALRRIESAGGALSWREFAALAVEECDPSLPASPGVPAGDFNRLRLRTVDTLFLLELNEGAWEVRPPAWPREWHAALGYLELADAARLRLMLLESGAEQVIRLTARLREGDEAYPHRHFIDTLCARHGAAAILDPAGGAGLDAGKALAEWLHGRRSDDRPEGLDYFDEWREGLAPPPLDARAAFVVARQRQRVAGGGLDWSGALRAAPPEGGTVSASLLEAWGRCPFTAFARRLRVGERADDERREDGEALEIGNLLHEVLHRFYAGDEHAAPWNGRWDAEARSRLVALVEGAAGANPAALGAAPVRPLELARLRETLARYLEARSSELNGAAPHGPCERELTPDEQARIGAALGVPLSGRIDRVEVSPGNRVIDYKTGGGAKAPAAALSEFQGWQAPFYMTALETLGERPARFEFHRLKAGRIDGFAADDGALRAAIDLVPQIARAARNGPFPPLPSDAACAHCDFQEACGRDWRDPEAWEAAQPLAAVREAVAGLKKLGGSS